MKILHTLRGVEATSGISTFVVELCNRQIEAGHQVCLVYQRSLEHSFSPKVLVLQESELSSLSWRPDVVHVHAIWTPFSLRMLRWCVRNKMPFVVSPHGCLMPRVFESGKLKKWIFLNLLLRPFLKKAKFWHCTSIQESEACKKVGFEGPFKVIPLGCTMHKEGGVRRNSVLFLGRISREKGLRTLLDVWKKMDSSKWVLKIAGPDWFGERSILESKIIRESIHNVKFVGIADALLKDALYREAKLFVLPSPMENFSAVVLDALSYGVPVIATRGTPWGDIETYKCGWWINQGNEALYDALCEGMSLTEDRQNEMSSRAIKLASDKYSWEKVTSEILELYCSVIK